VEGGADKWAMAVSGERRGRRTPSGKNPRVGHGLEVGLGRIAAPQPFCFFPFFFFFSFLFSLNFCLKTFANFLI
jgi:hypothetical protein